MRGERNTAQMNDLAATVERLRAVRAACRRFMQLHAMEMAVIEPGLDRVAADLQLDLDPAAGADVPDYPPTGQGDEPSDG